VVLPAFSDSQASGAIRGMCSQLSDDNLWGPQPRTVRALGPESTVPSPPALPWAESD